MTKKAKTEYTIVNPEGLAYVLAGLPADTPTPSVGDTIGLDLEDATETALLAAGWLSTESPKGGNK